MIGGCERTWLRTSARFVWQGSLSPCSVWRRTRTRMATTPGGPALTIVERANAKTKQFTKRALFISRSIQAIVMPIYIISLLLGKNLLAVPLPVFYCTVLNTVVVFVLSDERWAMSVSNLSHIFNLAYSAYATPGIPPLFNYQPALICLTVAAMCGLNFSIFFIASFALLMGTIIYGHWMGILGSSEMFPFGIESASWVVAVGFVGFLYVSFGCSRAHCV